MILSRKKVWKAPAGEYSNAAAHMLKQPHLLVAGATGSGKSVLINSLICTALYRFPGEVQFVLVDPKRVELARYRSIPHCMGYASEPAEIVNLLAACVDLMEHRFSEMQAAGQRETVKGHVYIVIDELADLITTSKKTVLPLLCRLAQLGRAAHIHLILGTQRPTSEIISGQLRVNLAAAVALRCRSAQDSKNIIGAAGAECLPRYGQALYDCPDFMQPQKITVPFTPEEEINRLIKWWNAQN